MCSQEEPPLRSSGLHWRSWQRGVAGLCVSECVCSLGNCITALWCILGLLGECARTYVLVLECYVSVWGLCVELWAGKGATRVEGGQGKEMVGQVCMYMCVGGGNGQAALSMLSGCMCPQSCDILV